ncbi:MAG: hypothetical protein ACFE9D_12400, partial [Promethearchaeota archaeon]
LNLYLFVVRCSIPQDNIFHEIKVSLFEFSTPFLPLLFVIWAYTARQKRKRTLLCEQVYSTIYAEIVGLSHEKQHVSDKM